MNKKIKLFLFTIILCIGLIALDQITKMQAAQLLKDNQNIILIPGALELTYLENTGAAFSMMNSFNYFQNIMAFVTPVFCIVLLIILFKLSKDRKYIPLYISVALVFCGAIGNYIDRIINQYVVDFIYFSLIDFPVFNVADIYVSLGFIAIAFLVIFKYKDEDEKEKNAE